MPSVMFVLDISSLIALRLLISNSSRTLTNPSHYARTGTSHTKGPGMQRKRHAGKGGNRIRQTKRLDVPNLAAWTFTAQLKPPTSTLVLDSPTTTQRMGGRWMRWDAKL
eukprot:1159836-Pelagomonas_calceolata.AAC.4